MASLVRAPSLAPPGCPCRMARARAWQWPHSSCRSSWWKTSRVGWRQVVSPDWTTFFTSCRGRANLAVLPVTPAQTIPLPSFLQRWLLSRGRGLSAPSTGPKEGWAGGVPALAAPLHCKVGAGGPSVPELCFPGDMEVMSFHRLTQGSPNERHKERGLSNHKVIGHQESFRRRGAEALGPVPSLGTQQDAEHDLCSRAAPPHRAPAAPHVGGRHPQVGSTQFPGHPFLPPAWPRAGDQKPNLVRAEGGS